MKKYLLPLILLGFSFFCATQVGDIESFLDVWLILVSMMSGGGAIIVLIAMNTPDNFY